MKKHLALIVWIVLSYLVIVSVQKIVNFLIKKIGESEGMIKKIYGFTLIVFITIYFVIVPKYGKYCYVKYNRLFPLWYSQMWGRALRII